MLLPWQQSTPPPHQKTSELVSEVPIEIPPDFAEQPVIANTLSEFNYCSFGRL